MTTPDSVTEAMKLVPCPFCGGKAVLAFADESYFVRCIHCKAASDRGPDYRAIAEWNRRFPSPISPTPQAVEALREALEELVKRCPFVPIENGVRADISMAQIKKAREALALSTPSPTDRLEEKPARHDEGEGLYSIETQAHYLEAVANLLKTIGHDMAHARLRETAIGLRSLSARNKELEELRQGVASMVLADVNGGKENCLHNACKWDAATYVRRARSLTE